MAILHGSWIDRSQGNYLFVWGETWRRVNPANSEGFTTLLPHPLAMSKPELVEYLQSLEKVSKALPSDTLTVEKSTAKKGKKKQEESQNNRWQVQVLGLPTQILEADNNALLPLHSGTILNENEAEISSCYLYPWQVEGITLNRQEAREFLNALPLTTINESDSFLGRDLQFWCHIARWSVDLLARCKFLPRLKQLENEFVAVWQPLLDSGVDQVRLENFARQMPATCRTYQGWEIDDSSPFISLELPPEPKELLLSFLSSAIDLQVRSVAKGNSVPNTENLVQKWLEGLGNESAQVTRETPERLAAILNAWIAPVQPFLTGQSLFRTCFKVHPPAENQQDWTLEYCLQAVDDPEFIVDATTIWQNPVERFIYQGRTIERPQETFLQGLGLASRLMPVIEPSLETATPLFCRLNPLEAYEFIKGGAWRFQDSGLGVILPPSLANRDGWASRLGLSIRAQTPELKPNQRLGLQSLLNFKWQLSIGGQTISKKEFDKLAAQNSPLVEINGEWVELRPQDVKSAKNFFASRKEEMSLSLEDALRLSTGDTQMVEKLPVVSFEASGVLQDLLNALTSNRAVEAIDPPQSFKGELRPYQARGVGWLAFLERWGLGACLADDMGLGKCIHPQSLVLINGNLRTAQEIWDTHVTDIDFDGEGFWSVPNSTLLVNAINEKNGQIIQTPIRSLYRQKVQEKLRIIRLKDGSNITITHRHKLLTKDGWNNNLKVGDYVCVPAKLVWEGKPEDPDLVKFIAWQIAEGYELKERGSMAISQKDVVCLEELKETFQRIGKRYNLKINCPKIRTFPGKVPALQVNSQSYRQFLEAKGYEWGKKSAEKSIPAWIMQADLNTVRIFLRNYFDAESAVISNMGSVEISTASALLIQQLSTLLRRFGIWLRISAKQKCATNGTKIFRTYYIGTLGGNSARIFWQEIGFGNLVKQQKLTAICQKVSNTNVEGIPVSDLVAETVSTTKLPIRHFGMHNTVYINGSQQFSRSSLEKVLAGCDRILSGEAEKQYRLSKSSKWTNQTLAAYAQLDTQHLSLTRQRLQDFFAREVFYCQIEEIEEIDYDGWVYDFEVSEHHNFVANNILCHNTIQFIAFLLHLKEENALEKPTLLVCPTSVLGNWEREVKKFGPSLKVVVHHGDKRPKGKALAKAVQDKHLVITSYQLVFRDVKDLQTVSWQGVVLDEAQNIKNPEAKQSQAVRDLEASFRVALTGTPVENRLSELWSILDFLNPGYLGPKNFFQRRFAIPVEKYGDTSSLKTLRSLVQPFILRRLKTDRDIIQDLPEKQEMNVFCGLTAEQAELYQKLVEESLAEIESSEGIQRRGQILALLVKLKQICNHPAQFLKEASLGNQKRSAKLLRLEEMLEEVISEGDRALIFTQFAEWGKLLKPYLEKQFNREMLFLYGSTSKNQREEMIDRFQNDPQAPRVMILSLKAGGTGLNLTRANHVFHFDRWWNPAVENQATDRVFRIGQTRNVQVHKFVCQGTLEEKIHDLIESKKALAEQVVGGGENWLTELDTDQLRNLLLLDRNTVIDSSDF
ncbi:SNF2-related protein [Floridanema flaviceps]